MRTILISGILIFIGVFLYHYIDIDVNSSQYIDPEGRACKVTDKNIFYVTVGGVFEQYTVNTIEFMIYYTKINI